MRSSVRAALLTTALFAAGCFGRVGYTASVSNQGYEPELVYVSPGVQVIADYDDSIFFADSFYWRFDGGWWYRSPHYTGGWSRAVPPAPIQRIDRPREFVHYRPQGWAGRGNARPPQQYSRDNREEQRRFEGRPPPHNQAPPLSPPPPQPAPQIRRPEPPPRGAGPNTPGGRPPWGGGREHGDDHDHDRRH